MTHTVALREFEGPLGLLLELVERGRLEVTAISVGEVTRQYLERLDSLETTDAAELSEFLQLGSRLVYIKSLSLLPSENEAELEELTQLNLELAEYRRYQAAARELAARSGRSYHRPVVERLATEDLPLPALSLEALAEVFAAAIRRAEPIRASGSIRHEISQDKLEKQLLKRLATGPISLQEELDKAGDRLEMVVLFSALLELIKAAKVTVAQANQFAPITIEAAGE